MLVEVQVKKLRLRLVRAELGLSQTHLARLSGVTEKTIAGAEQGKSILALTAAAILRALNAERANRDMPPLDFSQIDWKIQGE
jgi:DNA-binding XRE family transcriptional regulator